MTGYAADCAATTLQLYEATHSSDPRPGAAIAAAKGFALGGRRTNTLRQAAWAANRAAAESASPVAKHAALAAGHAAAAAYLHPLARSHQVKHILGSAAHAAYAVELAGGSGSDVLERVTSIAPLSVIDVLRRYPAAPPGGGRAGELLRAVDTVLRQRNGC